MAEKIKTGRSRGRATIKDVAARADASLKTVSRVLNREPNVRSEMRERVLEAMRELNYQPSKSARSLAGRRSFIIGLTYGNPRPSYLVEVLNGVLRGCHDDGYELFLFPFSHDDKDVVGKLRGMMMGAEIDGLVLSPPLCDVDGVLETLDEMNIPCARISATKHLDHPSPNVVMDDRAAARDMTTYLIGLGHRDIAIITGAANHASSHARLEGYKDALAEAGIEADPAFIVPGDFTLESGQDGARRLLTGGRRPTAIFASNDEMAAGAIFAVNEAGLTVPNDISVAGFDDTYAAKFVWPPLTTVHQPIYDMAAAAARRLLVGLRGQEEDAPVPKFSHRLVIRKSTAALE